MSVFITARVDGVPGPKGSVNAFCQRCAKRQLSPMVVVKEQSEAGVKFRKLVAKQLKVTRGQLAFTGPVETRLTFYIHRQRAVRAGVELAEWVPSHQTIVPTHRNSGDVEKHVRTVHDALMDAGVIADDSQVSDTIARKRWADADNPPGVMIEIREIAGQ